MPIQIDRKPGRKPLRRSGEAAGAIKPPGGPEAPPETLRIRMLRSINCRLGSFREGQAVELDRNTARSWIGFGFAEQDKMFDRTPEIK